MLAPTLNRLDHHPTSIRRPLAFTYIGYTNIYILIRDDQTLLEIREVLVIIKSV